MGSCVKAGGFEVLPGLVEQRAGAFGNGCVSSADQPVDVVHPEPDPFEMKGRNGARERFAFLDDISCRRPFVPLQQLDEIRNARGSRLPVIGSHPANYPIGDCRSARPTKNGPRRSR
jgi:hypothetical protein